MENLVQELAAWPRERVEALIAQAQPHDVDAAIAREERSVADLAALLSPHARPRLETMAHEAQRLTRWHFGRTIGLYAPIYLSNVCAADCLYCGFATHSGNKERRITLEPDAIRAECKSLSAHGFENVLLLTGEAPNVATIDYLVEAVSIANEYFSSVSIEMYAMDLEQYTRLCEAGLEGVTLYMETYDRETYIRVHQAGVKQDYEHRLNALERAGQAGTWKLNLGVLLGLFDWRVDALWMALHARYLQKHCWRSAVAISFPRLRHAPQRFEIPAPVSDADLVHMMLAMRLFLPEAGMVVSTRESAEFRDRLIPLGVTFMSAGSSTRPGGYATCGEETLEQFEIEDSRPPEEVARVIAAAGYDPVWKDFDRAFHV
ncbi:MAG: 2-iminoacetate synthase ThiH [Nitrospiraceae bacterium]|nr:2-iminoacetate synthase ThiH [Nitrospiraceae bacterium]